MKPKQYRSQNYKAEKCFGEIFVASADATTSLEPAREVFDDIAVAIDKFGEVILDPTRNAARSV